MFVACKIPARKNSTQVLLGVCWQEKIRNFPRRDTLARSYYKFILAGSCWREKSQEMLTQGILARPLHAPIYPTRWSIRKKTLWLGEDCKILEVSKNIPNSNLTQSNQWVLERYWRWVKNEQSSLKESDDCSRAGRTFRLLKDVCSKQKNVFKEFQRVHELWAPDRTLVQKKYT